MAFFDGLRFGAERKLRGGRRHPRSEGFGGIARKISFWEKVLV